MTDNNPTNIFWLLVVIAVLVFGAGCIIGHLIGIGSTTQKFGSCTDEEANFWLHKGVDDGEWRMAHRPCGYPGLDYGYPGHPDPYSNMCTITEDEWFALQNKTISGGSVP